ncbi:MAG: O-antigen ligase domain-containing protein [Hyphomicrobiales bacterium]|nr:MAG: O-antigen ligase domain-containing protein [Hyphomicrobiales bacterium]
MSMAGAVARRVSSKRTAAHDRMAMWLIVLVALSPVIIGGNMAIVWAIYALAIALTAAGYAWALLRRHEGLAVSLDRFSGLAALWGAVCVFVAVQSLPIAHVLGSAFPTRAGDLISSPMLSLTPGPSLLVLMQFVAYALLFVLFVQVGAKSSRSERIIRALFWVVVLFAAHGLLDWWMRNEAVLQAQEWAASGTATGTFVNRNTFATFLSLGLAAGMAVLTSRMEMLAVDRHHGVHWPARLLPTVAGLVVILSALLATQSRMGLLAGLIGAFVITALWAFRSRGGRIVPALLLIPLLAGIGLLYGAGTIERVGSVEQDFDVRWSLYAQVVEMIAARPWLGYGAGAFELAFPLFHQLPVSVDLVWDRAHSTYLTLWSELGVVFGSVPLLVIGLVLWRLVANFLVRSSLSAANTAAIGAIAVGAVHSLADFSLEIHAVAILFVALIGTGFAASYQRVTERGYVAA